MAGISRQGPGRGDGVAWVATPAPAVQPYLGAATRSVAIASRSRLDMYGPAQGGADRARLDQTLGP